MLRLLITGAILLGGHGHLQHHQQYWWPAQNACTITTGVRRDGSWQAIPYIQCTAIPAHYSNTQPPPMIGIPANSPQAQAFNQNYCPYKPGGWCSKPSGVANIGPGYAGN